MGVAPYPRDSLWLEDYCKSQTEYSEANLA
jgi:hypothetical protein